MQYFIHNVLSFRMICAFAIISTIKFLLFLFLYSTISHDNSNIDDFIQVHISDMMKIYSKPFPLSLFKSLIDKGFCARADIIIILSFQSSTSRTHNTTEMGSNGVVVVLVELVIRIKIDTH